jgi:wyosine [tRNA(Phe)-imidazoG37] synthetase (radical SAM superfamily)
MIAFGPIPSRRLGRSLGVNNIPPKVCSYSCVYCQIGETPDLRAERARFYDPQTIFDAVSKKVMECRTAGEHIDHLSFVPDGEPTLDINLGEEIDLLKQLGIPIAVISNGSLVYRADVREDLGKADWVCIKLDTASPATWHKINRPHADLDLPTMLEGIKTFATGFRGRLTTQTMLLRDLNDSPEEIAGLAGFTRELRPHLTYLSVPTRPPALGSVEPAGAETLNHAYQTFTARGIDVELITGYEQGPFASTGDVEHDILSITSVHPMREDSVRQMLEKGGSEWALVRRLLEQGLLLEVDYMGSKFYLRNLGHP